MDVPNTHALIQRASCHILGIWRNSDSSDTILNREGQYVRARFDVPEANSAIPTARCYCPTVSGKVKRVDILLVPCEGIPDGSVGDIPNLNMSVIYNQELSVLA